MSDSDSERSHAATPARRARARAEGHVPQSHDLSAAVVLLAGAGLLVYCLGNIAQTLTQVAREQLGHEAWLSADRGEIVARLRGTAFAMGEVLLPMLGLLFVVAVAVECVQTGFMFRTERAAPDLARIDPLTNLARLFSWNSLVRAFTGLVRVALVLGVGWLALRGELEGLLGAGALSPVHLAGWLAEVVPWLLLKVAGALVAWGAIDYGLAYGRHERSLAMTPQELREEMREMGGSRKAVARRKPLHSERTTGAVSSIDPS